jgi:hypothetical protein
MPKQRLQAGILTPEAIVIGEMKTEQRIARSAKNNFFLFMNLIVGYGC